MLTGDIDLDQFNSRLTVARCRFLAHPGRAERRN
jgi:hypothetical protein